MVTVMPVKIGVITQRVVDLLGIEDLKDANIFIGKSNIEHMMKRHPQDYTTYGDKIDVILASPDYVGQNSKDRSIEFIKEFLISGDFVKVAVRASAYKKFYVRSLYVLNNRRVHNFIQKGTLKKY